MLPHVFAVHNNGSVEKVTLLGISQFPRLVIDQQDSFGGSNTLGWKFKSDGVIMPFRDGSELTNAAEEWNSNAPNPRENYWIKMTFNNIPSARTPPSSNGASNWSSLSTTREVSWTVSGPAGGSVKVEIARDSLGQDIVATGYYGIRNETR